MEKQCEGMEKLAEAVVSGKRHKEKEGVEIQK